MLFVLVENEVASGFWVQASRPYPYALRSAGIGLDHLATNLTPFLGHCSGLSGTISTEGNRYLIHGYGHSIYVHPTRSRTDSRI